MSIEEVTEQHKALIQEKIKNARSIWEDTYVYGQSKEEAQRRQDDSFELMTARATIALTDAPLRRPMCGLTFEQYNALTTLFAGYARFRLSTSDFQTRYKTILPLNEEAHRYSFTAFEIPGRIAKQIPALKKLTLSIDGVPRSVIIPPTDIIYYYDLKLNNDGQPEIDRENIVVFDLLQSTEGYKDKR